MIKTKMLYLISILFCLLSNLKAQTNPIIIKWQQSTGYGKGYGANFLADVLKIQYSSSYVYINTNSIPSYSIGSWSSNPNNASAQNFTFKFPLSPASASTKTAVPLGHMGLWINGVSMYNADDSYSYNSLGVWKRNAYFWEGVSFDSCKGHPDGTGEYHHHISSSCLYNVSSITHSPLIGFTFDGFPVYGPYGYSSANSSSSNITRIKTSYKLRSITNRTSLANGTQLTSTYWGPTINTTYPLGAYIQDYEYSSGYGDLDEYNGRWCVTPEYPSGTYAYFVATDANLTAVYPFFIGPYFYGTPSLTNMGPGSGKASITESVTTYFSYGSNSTSSSNTTSAATTTTGKTTTTTARTTTTTSRTTTTTSRTTTTTARTTTTTARTTTTTARTTTTTARTTTTTSRTTTTTARTTTTTSRTTTTTSRTTTTTARTTTTTARTTTTTSRTTTTTARTTTTTSRTTTTTSRTTTTTARTTTTTSRTTTTTSRTTIKSG